MAAKPIPLHKLHYENMAGMLIRRDGYLHFWCPGCRKYGESDQVLESCPMCNEQKDTRHD